jgi:DNA-binding MarR family transcriptional regulator
MADNRRRRAALIARLEQRKQASVGQLLFRAARLYNERALARVRARVPAARQAHTTLLPHIDFGGTRLTEIARRAGITKQAVGQLVDEMVALGMLRRQADPDDARAQLITFTEEGLEQMLAGIDVLDEIERTLAAAVGEGTLARLRRDLVRLLPALLALDG